jgi:hypothetical protein
MTKANLLTVCAIYNNQAHEMRDLDLGYAPPFSPPYDPILIAADELQKKITGKK